MKLRLATELLDEVVGEALRHTDRRRCEHKIKIKQEEDFLLVKADARLIMQVIINLVDNAIKYTPPGSEVVIETKREGNLAVVTVADNGDGISDESKEHIFDMFYTAATQNCRQPPQPRASALALCKSIITAHGGTISVEDNVPHGAVFTFTLPMEEVTLHE